MLVLVVGVVTFSAILATLAARPARDRARSWGRTVQHHATGVFQRLERRFDAPTAIAVWYVMAFTLLLSLTVAAGTAVTLSTEGWLGELDRAATSYFAATRTEVATTAMQIASDVGDSITLTLLGIVLGIAWRLRRGGWDGLAVLAVSFLGAVTLYTVGKQVVARERPGGEPVLEQFPGLAFPSGHVTGSTAFYVAAALLIATLRIRWTAKVWMLAGAVTVALLVAISRVYLGAHWLSDVVFGAFLGAAWAVVAVTPLWHRMQATPERGGPAGP